MHVGESANKKSVLEELLEMGMVLVALDARADGVDVPDHLGRDPQLRLNLSFRFGLPMALDPWGISATLTFGGVPYACRFPWTAIYLLVSHVNGEPYLFPDEVPPELLAQVGVESAWSIQPSQKPAKGQRPKLSVVQSPPDEGEAPADTESAKKSPGKKADNTPIALEIARAAAKADDDEGEGDDEHDARPSRDGTARTSRSPRPASVRKVPRGPRAVEDLPEPAENAGDGKDDATPKEASTKSSVVPAPAMADARPNTDDADDTDDASMPQNGRTHADPPPPKSPPRRGHLRLVK